MTQVNKIGSYIKIMHAAQYQRHVRQAARERKLTPSEGASLSGPAGMAKPGSMLELLAEVEEKRMKSQASSQEPSE